MFYLPHILAFLTGKHRYKPHFVWSESWVYNAYRVYELIFWRQFGIRAESATNPNGYFKAFTWEAYFCRLEWHIRAFLAKLARVRVYIPIMVMPNGIRVPASPYLFAIAIDATSQAVSAGSVNSLTWAHTVTGSDPFLAVAFNLQTGTPSQTGVTYNGDALTGLTVLNSPFANEAMGWIRANPDTGTNNIVATRANTETALIVPCAASYSGCSGTQPDNQDTLVSPSATTASKAIVANSNNCWAMFCYYNNNGNAVSAGASTFERVTNASDNSSSFFDSDGTIANPPTSHTFNFSTAPTAVIHFGNMFTVAPSAGGSGGSTRDARLLSLLGVG